MRSAHGRRPDRCPATATDRAGKSARLLRRFGVPTVADRSVLRRLGRRKRRRRPAEQVGLAGGVERRGRRRGAQERPRPGARRSARRRRALRAALPRSDARRVVVQPMIAGGAGSDRRHQPIAAASGWCCSPVSAASTPRHCATSCIWPIPVSREAIVEQRWRDSSLGRVLASPRWQHPDAAAAFVDLLLALQNRRRRAWRSAGSDRHQPGDAGRGTARSRSMRWWCRAS